MLYDKSYKVETVPPYIEYNDDIKSPRFISDGMNELERDIKRAADFLIATIALMVLSPLFLLCYCLVKHEDGGPVIFEQERIGRFGRPFTIHKFRNTCIDAEKDEPQLYRHQHDKCMTKIGRYLRTYHLDGLSQLWNVVKGDMTLIGSRPERKLYIDQIMQHDSRYVHLYQIRPGVTSYATLYNSYTDTVGKTLKRLGSDLYYLEHRSWWLDMRILTKTLTNIAFGKIF